MGPVQEETGAGPSSSSSGGKRMERQKAKVTDSNMRRLELIIKAFRREKQVKKQMRRREKLAKRNKRVAFSKIRMKFLTSREYTVGDACQRCPLRRSRRID